MVSNFRNTGFQPPEWRLPIFQNGGFQNAGHWCHEDRNTQEVADITIAEDDLNSLITLRRLSMALAKRV